MGLSRAANLALLTRAHFDWRRAEAERASRDVQRSEFLALAMSGFSIADMSGGSTKPVAWQALFGNPRQGLQITRRAAEFDGVLSMGEQLGVPAALALSLYGSRTPVFCLFHGSYSENAAFSAAMAILRRVPQFHALCLSESVARLVTEKWKLPQDRCRIVGVGVDTEYFQPRPSEGPRVVASVGATGRDYPTLLEAVDGLDTEVEIDARSLWAGAAPVGSGRLPRNVTVAPQADLKGLRDLYARSRFVVVPVKRKPWASGYTAIAEAMAMGKAVIATDVPGRSDLIVPGETGLYVPEADPGALRAAIARLLADPYEAARMGEAGRRRILATSSLDRYCEIMRASIEEMLGAHPQAAAGRNPLRLPLSRSAF